MLARVNTGPAKDQTPSSTKTPPLNRPGELISLPSVLNSHSLLMCLAYMVQRKHMESHLWRAARSIRTLLSNLKVFPHLFRFIHNMGQFIMLRETHS